MDDRADEAGLVDQDVSREAMHAIARGSLPLGVEYDLERGRLRAEELLDGSGLLVDADRHQCHAPAGQVTLGLVETGPLGTTRMALCRPEV